MAEVSTSKPRHGFLTPERQVPGEIVSVPLETPLLIWCDFAR